MEQNWTKVTLFQHLKVKRSIYCFETYFIVFLVPKNHILDTLHGKIGQKLKFSNFGPHTSATKRAWPKKPSPPLARVVDFLFWPPETLNYHLQPEINCYKKFLGKSYFMQNSGGLNGDSMVIMVIQLHLS